MLTLDFLRGLNRDAATIELSCSGVRGRIDPGRLLVNKIFCSNFSADRLYVSHKSGGRSNPPTRCKQQSETVPIFMRPLMSRYCDRVAWSRAIRWRAGRGPAVEGVLHPAGMEKFFLDTPLAWNATGSAAWPGHPMFRVEVACRWIAALRFFYYRVKLIVLFDLSFLRTVSQPYRNKFYLTGLVVCPSLCAFPLIDRQPRFSPSWSSSARASCALRGVITLNSGHSLATSNHI